MRISPRFRRFYSLNFAELGPVYRYESPGEGIHARNWPNRRIEAQRRRSLSTPSHSYDTFAYGILNKVSPVVDVQFSH
jgi:hypothetical protein